VTRYSLTGISFPATPTRDGNGDRGDSLMVAALAVSSCSTVQLRRASVVNLGSKEHAAVQSNLIITPVNESPIEVDNLEVAQFIYLLLINPKNRHVIDAITSKVVLILGRFARERNAIFDAIRDELRKRNYLPALFDFEKPASRDLTENGLDSGPHGALRHRRHY
jgi:hypothetical protein